MNRPLALVALATASTLALAGCGASTDVDDGRTRVVASTNVYGSLAAQIGGDRVAVTSLIDSPARDPHSYEAGARDRLAVSRADLVIENGGGYDAFMGELLDGADARVITAVEFAPDFSDADAGAHDDDADHAEGDHEDDHGHAHLEGFNEHVWFDVHIIAGVVEQIAEDLTEIDPAGAADFETAAAALTDELTGFDGDIAALHDAHDGEKVFLTEPLPGRLAAAVGLIDLAPERFTSAVEEGNDVPPAVLLEALRVIEGGDVRAMLANVQTGGPETRRVMDAAAQADIPIAEFSELLQPDQSYADWMRAALSELTDALNTRGQVDE